MTDIADRTLKQMYDEYLQTGINDWQNIDTVVGNQLESLGLAEKNVQGDFKLSDAGIMYMSK